MNIFTKPILLWNIIDYAIVYGGLIVVFLIAFYFIYGRKQ